MKLTKYSSLDMHFLPLHICNWYACLFTHSLKTEDIVLREKGNCLFKGHHVWNCTHCIQQSQTIDSANDNADQVHFTINIMHSILMDAFYPSHSRSLSFVVYYGQRKMQKSAPKLEHSVYRRMPLTHLTSNYLMSFRQ